MNNLLVAGASRGLGKFVYEYLKQEYDYTIGISRTGDNDTVMCDINSPSGIDRLLNTIKPITHLVCTAGVYGPLGPFHQRSFDDWQHAVRTNLFGPARLAHALIPNMIKNGYGKIVFLSGGGATRAMYGASSYGASKSGLVRFAETLAHELEQYNIDVNCVAPGPMDTLFLDQALKAGISGIGEEFYAECLHQKEIGGAGFEPAANLIKYLLSSESDNITGRLISAIWDKREDIPKGLSDQYTLKRIK